jgi:hypothetical protein
MTWAIRHSPELAKGVIGVAKAFGICILLFDQASMADLADRLGVRLTLIFSNRITGRRHH